MDRAPDVYSYLSLVGHEEILTVLNLIVLSRFHPLLLPTTISSLLR
jgi:hypothetical protein